jgi:hypothetical protein
MVTFYRASVMQATESSVPTDKMMYEKPCALSIQLKPSAFSVFLDIPLATVYIACS